MLWVLSRVFVHGAPPSEMGWELALVLGRQLNGLQCRVVWLEFLASRDVRERRAYQEKRDGNGILVCILGPHCCGLDDLVVKRVHGDSHPLGRAASLAP